MRKLVVVVFAILALLLPAASGCAKKKPPPVAEAEGEITYNGEPVKAGIISFLSEEAAGRATGGAAVVDGKYRLYREVGLPPGKYRIEIRWGKPTGEKKKDVGYGQSPDVIAEALPDKYNSESILTAELQEGANTIDFHLDK